MSSEIFVFKKVDFSLKLLAKSFREKMSSEIFVFKKVLFFSYFFL